MKDRGELYKTR